MTVDGGMDRLGFTCHSIPRLAAKGLPISLVAEGAGDPAAQPATRMLHRVTSAPLPRWSA